MAGRDQYLGNHMVGRDGEVIGSIERVFGSDATGAPSWVTVRMGALHREHVIPLEGAQVGEDTIRVPYTQAMVKNSPKLDFDEHLSAEDVGVLSQYYGTTAAAGKTAIASTPTAAAAAPAGPAGETHAMTGVKVPQDMHRDATLDVVRYGERLQVAKENREAGRVKVRKYVESVPMEQKVQLQHEAYEVERIPITDTAQFTGQHPDWAEQVQELVLFGEQAHASKEVVPLERIVVRKKMVSEEKVIRDTIRTEQFEVIEAGTETTQAAQTAGRDAMSAAGNRTAPLDPNRR